MARATIVNKKLKFFQKSLSLLTGLFLVLQSLAPGFFALQNSVFAQEETPASTDASLGRPAPTETVTPAPEDSPTPTAEATLEATAEPTVEVIPPAEEELASPETEVLTPSRTEVKQ